MKLVLISDTHEKHRQLVMPKGDVLIHAGDATFTDKEEALIDYFAWLQEQSEKYEYVFHIAGNHSLLHEEQPERARVLREKYCPSVFYLENSELIFTVDGKSHKIYGSPITPKFFDWAFMRSRGEALRQHWKAIPDDVDILITHGPPYGILDSVKPHPENNYDTHAGCKDLLARTQELAGLKLHVFGHIHAGHGAQFKDNKLFVNASVLDDNYKYSNSPIKVVL